MTSIWWYCLDVLFGHGRTQGLAPTCLYEALQPKSQNPGAAALSCGEGLDRDSRRARKTALALDQTWREWSAQSNSWNLGTEITQNCVDDENLTVVLVIHGLFTKVQGFWPISVSQSVERKIACRPAIIYNMALFEVCYLKSLWIICVPQQKLPQIEVFPIFRQTAHVHYSWDFIG